MLELKSPNQFFEDILSVSIVNQTQRNDEYK